MSEVKKFLNELGETARASLRHPVESAFTDGYDVAAEVCLRVLQTKLDDLLAQMNSASLSAQDQVLCASLLEVKSRMEAELYAYWESRPE